ncbi:Uncharacterised protein [uncultured archaeon]|nr:Uncharacterised protein [uncultured archaeon]
MLAAVLALMFSSVALAAPETHQVGPYKVSFDMNTNTKYQVQTVNPQGNSMVTVYLLVVKTDNTTGASININEYKTPVDSTPQMQGVLTLWSMRARGINATGPMNQTIDGKNGFLIAGAPFAGSSLPAGIQFYQAQYWLDSKQCECGPVSVGTTGVDITSTYPQDVTMNLLKSISVVKSA